MIITMRNRGLDSFKLEEYGQQLVVHRTLKDDGGTAYKLKAANGQSVCPTYILLDSIEPVLF